MLAYQCPICSSPLSAQNAGQVYACEQQHHFDVAKAGYLNLLAVQHKHSLEPGDSKAMLQARRAFLEAGYFKPLVDQLAEHIKAQTETLESPKILDLGCGEGYYTRSLAAQIPAPAIQWHGIDIAKFAIAAAAKKQHQTHFAVGSTKRLPYLDQYFDGMLRIFAPAEPSEIKRVLKPEGFLIMVTPGPSHLWALKALIYPEVRAHPSEVEVPAGFNIRNQIRLQTTIQPAVEHRLALLQMTPFAWKANGDTLRQLQNDDPLAIELDFCITLSSRSIN